MKYTFSILCVSPLLSFFNHQQEIIQQRSHTGVEYLGAYKCTLDAFIQSIETVPPKGEWNLDQVVSTVVDFWMNNSDSIRYWKDRLQDAGNDNILVARVADINSLKSAWESLLGENR